MISTSSSECNCPIFPFNTNVPNFIGNNFCQTARQPLIYYARIQEPFYQQQSRGHTKDNSNCFMKAFQWYTQERNSDPRKETADSRDNHSDFAAWLDRKYSEYLKRSQQDGSQLILKQSPILKGEMSKKKKSRKFGRMRSPWKRRHQSNSNEKGDNPPINQSIEFILQPQDLQKPTSECCQRNSRIQSSTTIISKESPKYTKVKVKSKSLLSVYRAQEVCNKEVKTKSHAKTFCQCLKNDKGTQYETFSLESLTTARNYNARTPGLEETNISDVITKKYSPQRISRSNVLCQCSEVNPYDLPLHKYTSGQDGRSNGEYKTDTNNQAYSSKIPKVGVAFTKSPDTNMKKVENCSAQTSDHSINIYYLIRPYTTV